MRQFIAIAAPGGMTSGLKKTRQEAEAWALEVLCSHPKISQIAICESIARLERDTPPIRTIELKHDLQDEIDACASKSNGIDHHDSL